MSQELKEENLMANNNKTKKISITAFEKIMKETHIPTSTVEWNGVEITIKHTLSFKEALTFVDNVTKSCFTTEQNTYLPEIKEFAIRCCILEMYANFAMPSNIEHKYDLVYCTDAVTIVTAHINKIQLGELIDAINDKIDNLAQANIEAVNRQMNELYSAFDNLQEQISSIFTGIGSDDISKMVSAISGGQFDESKLVQAYIDQTSTTKNEDGE